MEDIFESLRRERLSVVHERLKENHPELFETWHSQLKDPQGEYRREFGDNGTNARWKERTPHTERGAELDILSMIRGGLSCYVTARYYTGTFLDINTLSLDRIFLDFDSSDSPGKALREAGMAYDNLLPIFDEIKVRFSGSKGCHLIIDGLEPGIPRLADTRKKVLRRFVEEYIDPLELKTHDRKVSVDINRLQRIVNTRHPKTGLWCIPVSREELDLGIDEIRKQAKEPRLDFTENAGTSEALKEALESAVTYVYAKERQKERLERTLKDTGRGMRAMDGRGMKYLSGNQVSAVHSDHCPGVTLALKGVGEGSRSLAALGLKKFWKLHGMYTPAKLASWNEHNTPAMDRDTLEKVLSREPGNSFCYFLNQAELCPTDCKRLSKR
jgi:hypothetical protein